MSLDLLLFPEIVKRAGFKIAHKEMKFSVVIPNWNGKKLLEKNLPRLIRVLRGVKEVIVVDNGSTDGSLELIGQISLIRPIRLISNPKNLGFAIAVNQGVAAATGDIILSVNNDVYPQNNFLKILEKDFADLKVFAVSFNEVNTPYGPAKGEFKNGFFSHYPGKKTKSVSPSYWVSGGSGAFRKSMWDQLGGLDENFKFYWEDVDIGYRAQERGWRCLWEPEAKVVHEHEATSRRLDQKYKERIQQRNQLWFIWKNLSGKELLIKHFFALGTRLVTNPGYILIFLMALWRIPGIILFRLKKQK